MALHTNREICSGQLHDALAVVATISNHIGLQKHHRSDEEDPKPGGANDGGPVLALENTLTKALARLDRLIESDRVWEIPVHDGHFVYHGAMQAQRVALELQAQATGLQLDVARHNLSAGPVAPRAPRPKRRNKKNT